MLKGPIMKRSRRERLSLMMLQPRRLLRKRKMARKKKTLRSEVTTSMFEYIRCC
jgi:hypothetical protein